MLPTFAAFVPGNGYSPTKLQQELDRIETAFPHYLGTKFTLELRVFQEVTATRAALVNSSSRATNTATEKESIYITTNPPIARHLRTRNTIPLAPGGVGRQGARGLVRHPYEPLGRSFKAS